MLTDKEIRDWESQVAFLNRLLTLKTATETITSILPPDATDTEIKFQFHHLLGVATSMGITASMSGWVVVCKNTIKMIAYKETLASIGGEVLELRESLSDLRAMVNKEGGVRKCA